MWILRPSIGRLFLSYVDNNGHRILDGAICLHVDDMLGTANMTKSGDLHMSLAKHIDDVKPIALMKDRAADKTGLVSDTGRRLLQGLLGTMTWSAIQAIPSGLSLVRISRGDNDFIVATVQLLQFMKANGSVICKIAARQLLADRLRVGR